MDTMGAWDKIIFAWSISAHSLRRLSDDEKVGKEHQEYFLSGRVDVVVAPGFSLVATTFAADTPNFVTELVRTRSFRQSVGGRFC